jgi:hypothetical protein
MKKTLAASILILAIVVGVFGVASTATATPGKSKSCSVCHHKRTAVKITLTRSSSTSTTVTYKIKVTGGKGRAGWAVFQGAKNIKHKTASTGMFTLAKGKTYKVWAVKKSTGSRSKVLLVK